MRVSEKQFEVGYQSTIELSINKGRVAIWGWDNSNCKVQAEEGQKIDLDYSIKNSKLEMEICGGEGMVNIHIPRYCKLLLEGSHVDTTIANIEGNIMYEVGKGSAKLSNIEGKVIVEMEKGDIELENTRGKWYIENGNGNIQVFKSQGNLRIDNGYGDIELININGECDVDNGRGEITVKEGKGSLNIYNGIGDITIEHCTFKRLAADGKGNNNLLLDSNQQGVWRLSRLGDYSIKVPVIAKVDFQIDCKSIENSVPGLSFNKREKHYKGTLGYNSKGSLHIEEALDVSLTKGISEGIVDGEKVEEQEKETLKILDMLKQGIITLEQANELLDAIDADIIEGVDCDERREATGP